MSLTTTGMIPHIAVDASGNIDVIWRDESSSSARVMFTRSTDGGATFSTPAPISAISGGQAPLPTQIAVDSTGTIDVLAQANSEVFSARSTDGGKTFSVVPITNGQGVMLYAPVMALGPNGSVNILWMSAVTLKFSLSRSTDGATFSTTTVWNWPGTGGSNGNSALAVDAGEDIYAAWPYCSGNPPMACNVLFSRSTDQGKTFSAPATLGVGTAPAMLVDSSGSLDLTWNDGGNIFFSRSTDLGASFSTPVTVSQGTSQNGSQLAVDSKSDIFVTWFQVGTGLLFSGSTNAGGTFSAPKNLGNPTTGLSQIAVDSSDNIDITEALLVSTGDFQIVFLRSADGGNTFSKPVQASNDTQKLCPTLGQMVLEKGGDIDVVWEEFASPFGAIGVKGCDSSPNQVLFSRGAFTQSTSAGIGGSVTPTSATIPVGGSANFSVSLKSSGGFSGSVNLSCGGAPSGVNCSFAPAQADLLANGTATSTLTVQVAVKPSLLPPGGALRNAPLHTSPRSLPQLGRGIAPDAEIAIFLLAGLAVLFPGSMRGGYAAGARSRTGTILVVGLASFMLSCSGTTSKSMSASAGGTMGTTGTTAGNGGTGGMGGTGGSAGSGGSGGSSGTSGTGGTAGGSASVTVQFSVQAQSGGTTADLGAISVTVP